MEPLMPTNPDDLSSLAMENQLLRYEIDHLRARLAAQQPGVENRQRQAEESTARRDLVWLLSRLDSSPAARLLRRRPRYRELVSTYLPAPEDRK